MVDVAIAIDLEAVNVTHARDGVGSYAAGGKFTPGVAVSSTIRAAIQPASGRQMMDMPEGIRDEARYLAWSRVPLLNLDRITYAGITYKIIFVWPRLQDGFYRAALGEVAP